MIKKVFILLMVSVLELSAQISPGELTEAHANLEGMSNCTKCHEIGEAVTNQKCLDCHTEINDLIAVKRGYHSDRSIQSKRCIECHSEHHGRNFNMIRFDQENFDHNLTGFELTGKHKDAECNDCHKSELISNESIKTREGTFLGLGTSCKSCHEDYHRNTLSANCNDCHTTNSFKPAELFNHNNAEYKLTGLHKNVECAKCHKIEERDGEQFQVFKGIKFSSCSDCHTDVHKGKLGANCESCHSTRSFHKLEQENIFDHDKTDFPLIGRHSTVDCQECHTTNFKRVLKHSKCIDCHTDYHNGELVKSGEKYDCNSCHTENRFYPSRYSIDDHNNSTYKLTGSHLAVPCSGCHKKESKWTFKLQSSSCSNCHPNVHGTTISGKFLNDQNCNSCHITETWIKVDFNHDETKFILEGKHNEAECYECHDINKTESTADYIFAGLSMACESCHVDPHFNQFRKNDQTDCSRCHASADWKPVNFSHENTKFPLRGAHAKVECIQCHQRKVMPAGTFVKYRYDNTECITCHTSGTKKN